MFVERKGVGTSVDLKRMTDDELLDLIRRESAALGVGLTVSHDEVDDNSARDP